MAYKWLNSFIFIFLLSFSAHIVHEVVAHEEAVCEVCLHSNSNDDALAAVDSSNDHRIHRSNQISELWISAFVDALHHSSDPIRGPPIFS